MAKRHYTIISEDKKEKLKSDMHLSEKMVKDMIYMYERDPELEEDVERLINETIKSVERTSHCNCMDTIIKIDLFFPIKLGINCVEYDYINIINAINNLTYDNELTNHGTEEIFDISYIRCVFTDNLGNLHTSHYIEYMTQDINKNTIQEKQYTCIK